MQESHTNNQYSSLRCLEFHTGNKIPQIGYGTFQLKQNDCQKGINIAINGGYRHIDTASIYKNEQDIAIALQQIYISNKLRRQDLFITSKISPYEQGYENTLNACQQILNRLQTNYVDLLLIHWPGAQGRKLEDPENQLIRLETWKAMIELQKQGKVKDIGVSNFMLHHMEHLFKNSDVKPVINQFEIHPLCVDQKLIDFCNNNKIVVQAYSSLARNDGKVMQNENLMQIAQNCNKSVAQICLRWAIQRNFVIIPKSKSQQFIEANMNIFDFELNQDQIDIINSLNEDYHTCWNPNTVIN